MDKTEQQVVKDLYDRIKFTKHALNYNHPSGQLMTETILANQLEIMRFLLYVRTGIRQE